MSEAGLELTRLSPTVAQIEFTRPERRNPIDAACGQALNEALEEVERDDDLRAVIITGRGGTFSAGGDVDRIASLPQTPEQQIADDFGRRFAASRTIVESQKAYIAAISGATVGAAFGLAMACDLRIGDGTAMFLAPFSMMGLVPDYGLSWLLPRAIGTSAALQIAWLSERIDAEEALRVGILNRIVDDPHSVARQIADRIAARPAYGIGHTKRLAHAAHDRSLADGLADEIAVQAHGFHEPAVQRQVENYTQSIGSRGGSPQKGSNA